MADSAESLTKGINTRNLILDSAACLFLEHGYHGTSMRQIARGAGGFAVGGLYNHFQSKEEIFSELLQKRMPWREILEIIDKAEGDTGLEMMRQTFLDLQVLFNQNLNITFLILVDIRELNGRNTGILANRIYPELMTYLARVKEKGGIRENISLLTILRSFVGMLIGYLMTQVIGASLLGTELEYTLPDLERTLFDSSDMIEAMFHGIALPAGGDERE